jgi:hypothetical protein
MRKSLGLTGFAASLFGMMNKQVMNETRQQLNYAEDGSKPTNKRKKVKLARKANLQRIKNHK